MERVVQALVEGVLRKVASGKTAFCWSESVLSMAEEVAKWLVDLGPEVLFGVLELFLGGSGKIAIVILKNIIGLRPRKKD